MSEDGLIEKTSYFRFVDFIQSVVTTYERGDKEEYNDVKKDINTLIEKLNDDNLYLGVIGSFSSGKSTFINSMISKNLLPTDAVQGTTVAASILKKAEYDDLEITYNDGRIERFSENPDKMLLEYKVVENGKLILTDKSLLFIKKIIVWIKKLFSMKPNKINSDNNDKNAIACIALFRKIVATEELATNIKCVTLYYQNINLPYRIAVVDTPGIESLNKRHNDVTKNTIDNICDAVVVIIPYDEPVSEELLDHINTNLDKSKSECIFVVTKVELLEDKDELSRLLQVIERRLENGLSIESACVIPMPTLVYLKSVDLEMKTTFLNDINDAEKNDLIRMYQDGVAKINKLLEKNKNRFIKNKIINICERLSTKLNSNLMSVVYDYDEKRSILKNELVKPLTEFEELSKREIKNYCEMNKKKIIEEISFVQMQFSLLISNIEAVISGCSDSQQLINQLDFNCKDTLIEVQKFMDNKYSKFQNGINCILNNIEKEFKKTYGKCPIYSNVKLLTNTKSDLFNDVLLSELEMLFQSTSNEIRSLVGTDTRGLFNKVKSFFSNPLDKHKEIALSSFLNIIEIINVKTQEYVLEYTSQVIVNDEKNAMNSVKSMIRNNKNIIEDYTNSMKKALKENLENREYTKVCIKKLNQYIKRIKEVC